jgi:hypothetical protein
MIVLSFNFYSLYCLPEDDRLSSRNMYEGTVYKNCFINVHFIGIIVLLLNNLRHNKNESPTFTLYMCLHVCRYLVLKEDTKA